MCILRLLIHVNPYFEKNFNRHSIQESRTQTQSPTRRAELSCERNDLKHRDNESEGNSTVGIIRGAMDKIEGTREKNKNEFIFDNC